jgi:hypothetical protein
MSTNNNNDGQQNNNTEEENLNKMFWEKDENLGKICQGYNLHNTIRRKLVLLEQMRRNNEGLLRRVNDCDYECGSNTFVAGMLLGDVHKNNASYEALYQEVKALGNQIPVKDFNELCMSARYRSYLPY